MTVSGRARLVGLATGVALACAGGPAGALLLTLNPHAGIGLTNNAHGAVDRDLVQRQLDEYATFGISSALQWTLPRATHRLGYGFNSTRYLTANSADVVTHDGVWSSNFTLSPRINLGVGAVASVFQTSAVPLIDPGTVTTPPVGQATAGVSQSPTSILTASVSQALTYEPTGTDKYSEGVSVSTSRSLASGTTIPQTLQVGTTERWDKIKGRNTYSLTVVVGDFSRLDTPVVPVGGGGTYSSGHIVTTSVLAGWRRDLSARTAVDLQGGLLALYGTDAGSLAVGPSGVATLSYRFVPWFATVTAAHQPSVNIYLGEAVIADSLTARASMPVNRRETVFISGSGGYTYARRVTGDSHFVFASRYYDLLNAGAALSYRLERWPVGFSLDYTVTSQRGSAGIPSTARQTIGLSVGGALAWGEGNAGWLYAR